MKKRKKIIEGEAILSAISICIGKEIEPSGFCISCGAKTNDYFCSEICADIYLKEEEKFKQWEMADDLLSKGYDWCDVDRITNGNYI